MINIDIMRKGIFAANKLIIENAHQIEAPCLHSYPKNCCEVISKHLALVLEAKLPNSQVRVARAYRRSSDEYHFWIEVDHIVLDVTAHQFIQYSAPLVCFMPSPLEGYFNDVERLNPCKERDEEFQICPCLLTLLSTIEWSSRDSITVADGTL